MIAFPAKRKNTRVFDSADIAFVVWKIWVFHENDLSKLVQYNKIDIILGPGLPVNLNSNTSNNENQDHSTRVSIPKGLH